jgi:hypothetical protein
MRSWTLEIASEPHANSRWRNRANANPHLTRILPECQSHGAEMCRSSHIDITYETLIDSYMIAQFALLTIQSPLPVPTSIRCAFHMLLGAYRQSPSRVLEPVNPLAMQDARTTRCIDVPKTRTFRRRRGRCSVVMGQHVTAWRVSERR